MSIISGLYREILLAQRGIPTCFRLTTDLSKLAFMTVPWMLPRCYVMRFCTAAKPDSVVSKVKTRKKKDVKKKSTPPENNSLAVNSLTERRNLPPDVKALLNNFRNELARTVVKASGTYILDPSIANNVVKCLDIKESKVGTTIFEANPGPGIMTQAFLEAGVSTLRVFEKRKVFLTHLQKLQKKYSSRLEIVEDNFLDLSKIESRHRLTFETTMDSVFRDVPITEWTAAPPLQIFAILPKPKELPFLRFILAKLPRFQSLFSLGRTQLFLFVSGKEYWSMTAKPNDKFVAYRNTSVLFQIFFDVTLLLKEPNESFFPPEAPKSTKQPKYDCNHMYLISLTPKRHLFDLVSPNLILELTFFVRHHLMKRKRLICHSLEQWIPGCTSRLIEEGLDVNAVFGELTPQQVLTLFLNFSSWPEYNDCLFRTAARKDSDDFNYNWTADDVKEASADENEALEEEVLMT